MSARHSKLKLCAIGLLLGAWRAEAAPTPVQSFHELPTGNGFGFSVFDASAHKVTQFLERPYRFLGPGTDPKGAGVYRRDLAYDVYFGARTGGAGAWLPDRPQDEVGYLAQSGVVRSVAQLGSVKIESHFVAPYGFEGNALVMIARATNVGGSATTVDLFALPNFRLGGGDPDNPSALGETIASSGARSVETGALGETGGAMVYLPLGAVAKADCSGGGYDAVKAGGELPSDQRSCSGDDRTIIFQSSSLSLAPGETKSFGLFIGFAESASSAGMFGDAMTSFVASRGAEQLLTDLVSEWEAWRKPAPAGLSDEEKRVYRQAEATLRMAQVREPFSEQPKRKGQGMILASLPPGEWHIGWVRDATYAVVALAKAGHLAEAKAALRFFLSAEASTYTSYTNGAYRISITRYFGDGQEESDWNAQGPNIEFDGWGLFLWALRQTLDADGTGAFLEEQLPTQERVFDVVRDLVGDALERNIDNAGAQGGGMILPDTSIWESHWDNRKHYTYTSLAAARGLCDLAALETSYGEAARAEALRQHAGQVSAALRASALDKNLVLGGSKEGVAGGTYHDGAVLEAFNWELFPGDDPLYPATLASLESTLRVPSSGWKRNDDALSKYDSNEWIFIDMRAAQAFRRMGNAPRSDELIAWVTAQARANFDLIPELFNTFASDGPLWSYTGATPMVGFGAGAYMLALRDRAGEPEHHGCGAEASDGGVDGGIAMPGDSGCSCALGGRARVPCAAAAFVALGVLGVFVGMRRRRA